MSINYAVSLAYQCRKQGVSLLLLLLNLTGSVHLTSATCYYPDGSIAAGDTPCSSSVNSTCCGSGYACLSNRICMATGDEVQHPDASLYVRGSCTDRSWKDASCPLFCISSDDLLSGGTGIAKCPNTQLDEYYCIDSGDSSVNCVAQFNVFEFPGTPSALTTIGVIGTATITSTTSSSTTLITVTSTAVLPPPGSVAASSFTTSTATITSTTSSSTTLVTTTSTAVLPPPSSTTSTAISLVAPSAISSSAPPSQPAPSINSVAIGVGVAVFCGLTIAGLLGLICFRRKKSHRVTASKVKQSQDYVDDQNRLLSFQSEIPSP